MVLGVDSASNRNEYQEHFLAGKGGRCERLTTYDHPVPLSRNLGTLTSWNPLSLFRPEMGLLCLFSLFTSNIKNQPTSLNADLLNIRLRGLSLRRGAGDVLALQSRYAAYVGNSFPKFRNSLSVTKRRYTTTNICCVTTLKSNDLKKLACLM